MNILCYCSQIISICYYNSHLAAQYESELKEVEATERDTQERFNALKAKYTEVEGEWARLQVVCGQQERELAGVRQLTEVLQGERGRLADVIRQDFAERLVGAEEENGRLKGEAAEARARRQCEGERARLEVERLGREKAEELAAVHEKRVDFFVAALVLGGCLDLVVLGNVVGGRGLCLGIIGFIWIN